MLLSVYNEQSHERDLSLELQQSFSLLQLCRTSYENHQNTYLDYSYTSIMLTRRICLSHDNINVVQQQQQHSRSCDEEPCFVDQVV